MINFIEKTISNALQKAESKEFKNYILKHSLFLSNLNINNKQDLLKFHYIVQYVPYITKQVLGTYDKNICAKISSEVFCNFNKIKSFIDLKNIIYNCLKAGLTKIAYPMDMGDNEKIINYDLNKWRSAINDIHIRSKIFGSKKDAIDFVTKDWGNMDEKLDFERWLKFYEEGNHKKYKLAQYAPQVQIPFIPGLSKKEPEQNPTEREFELDRQHKEITNSTKSKLLGRIDSAIRILHTNLGMEFAGKDYNKLVDTLLSLKGDIMKIKSSLILEDLIIRAGSSLQKETKDLFFKIAQLPPLDSITDAPDTSEPPSAPEQKQETNESNGNKALEEFVENSVTNTFEAIRENYKDQLVEKEKFAWYNTDTPEFVKFKNVCKELGQVIFAAKKFNSITRTAQEAPLSTPVDVPAQATPAPAAAPVVEEKQPTLQDKLKSLDEKPAEESLIPDDISTTIENALDDIKLSDVIKHLQALSRVFKNREIARQLGIIDLMLNKLGISGFFPSLAEATRSALESNQYCQTRIEEILSKLISVTDEKGLSDFDELPKQEDKSDNIIDKQMKDYLEEPKKIEKGETPQPEQKVQQAPPQPPNV